MSIFSLQSLFGANKTQTHSAPANHKNSLTYRLKKIYRYEVDMAMDQWKEALRLMDDPHRPEWRPMMALYHQSTLDAQLTALLQTRRLKVLGSGFVLKNATGHVLPTPHWLSKVLGWALDAVFYGHSLMELQTNNQGHTTNVLLISRDYVVPPLGVVRPNPDQTDQTINYRQPPYHNTVIEAHSPTDQGLLLKAVPYVIWKRYAHSDWSRHSEKYGMPFMVIKTQSRDERELDAKAEMAARMGNNGYAILDEQDEITLLESNQSNPSEIYKQHIITCDQALNKLILGQTLTTDAGSSRAQAEVHERILDAYLQADKSYVQNWVNTTLLPKINLNQQTDLIFEWN